MSCELIFFHIYGMCKAGASPVVAHVLCQTVNDKSDMRVGNIFRDFIYMFCISIVNLISTDHEFVFIKL
jgi:hypothetical protein